MAATFKEGDRVQVVEREATPEDVKSGLFYNHFRGLIGTIQKVYPTQEVAVEIEPESLPEPIAQRHRDVQEQMRPRRQEGQADDADKDMHFHLRYTILVTLKDLTAPGKKAVAPAPPQAIAPPRPAVPHTVKPPAAGEAGANRPTSADYDAAEEAELRRRQGNGKHNG